VKQPKWHVPQAASFLELDHHRKWASVICHPTTGLRRVTIMKRDPSAKMPSDDFRMLLFLFCPCSFSFSFTDLLWDGTEGGKRIERGAVFLSWASSTPQRESRRAPSTASRPPRCACLLLLAVAADKLIAPVVAVLASVWLASWTSPETKWEAPPTEVVLYPAGPLLLAAVPGRESCPGQHR
jgi:hypothetical protein